MVLDNVGYLPGLLQPQVRFQLHVWSQLQAEYLLVAATCSVVHLASLRCQTLLQKVPSIICQVSTVRGKQLLNYIISMTYPKQMEK